MKFELRVSHKVMRSARVRLRVSGRSPELTATGAKRPSGRNSGWMERSDIHPASCPLPLGGSCQKSTTKPRLSHEPVLASSRRSQVLFKSCLRTSQYGRDQATPARHIGKRSRRLMLRKQGYPPATLSGLARGQAPFDPRKEAPPT